MFTLSLDHASADYKALSPGDFFIFEAVTDDQAIAVVLQSEDEKLLRVLTLTGKDAFFVRDFELDYNHHLVPLEIDAERLRIRVDPDSGPGSFTDHLPGRLSFSAHSSPAIEVMYGPDKRQPTPRVVYLKNWEMRGKRDIRFGFLSWALGHLDETQNWVDLVKRPI